MKEFPKLHTISEESEREEVIIKFLEEIRKLPREKGLLNDYVFMSLKEIVASEEKYHNELLKGDTGCGPLEDSETEEVKNYLQFLQEIQEVLPRFF